MQKKFLILAFLMVAISAEVIGNICRCSELATQADCTYDGDCVWSGQACSDTSTNTTNTTTPTCASMTSSYECHQIDNCGWTIAGVCGNFTKCADYQYSKSNAEYCVSVGSGCTIGTVGDTNVTCADGSLDCTSIKDKTVCTSGLKLNTYEKCIWESESCKSFDYSKCTTINLQDYCTNYNCIWENEGCKAPYCSYYKTESSCYNRRGDVYSISKTLCNWVNNTCTDMDTSVWTAANCYKNTSYTYYWSGTSCNACAGSYSKMLVLVGTLIFMMI